MFRTDHRHRHVEISVRGATGAEIERGEAAAENFFSAIGISAKEAAQGALEREGWTFRGFPPDAEPGERAMMAADAWQEADRVALEACCLGWRDKPRMAHLRLID